MCTKVHVPIFFPILAVEAVHPLRCLSRPLVIMVIFGKAGLELARCTEHEYTTSMAGSVAGCRFWTFGDGDDRGPAAAGPPPLQPPVVQTGPPFPSCRLGAVSGTCHSGALVYRRS